MKEELNVSNVKQWTYPFIFLPVSFPVLMAPSMYLCGDYGLVFQGSFFC